MHPRDVGFAFRSETFGSGLEDDVLCQEAEGEESLHRGEGGGESGRGRQQR